ncbi:unnamed protein product [Caenorhabditis angaria]|uniref:ABC transporter domain-containing protein n=1 Tax=Caenorhabditis angaria TaxID=860376 RepID=A0A9P1MWS7_9PELO|nr:unnamed protein product [Caenorhabditis angaria]
MLWTLILKDIRIMYRSKVYSIFEILIVMLLFGGIGFLVQLKVKDQGKEQDSSSTSLFHPISFQSYINYLANSYHAGNGVVFEESAETRKNISATLKERDEYMKKMEDRMVPNIRAPTPYIGIKTDFKNFDNKTINTRNKMRFDVTLATRRDYYKDEPWVFEKGGGYGHDNINNRMADVIEFTAPSEFNKNENVIFEFQGSIHESELVSLVFWFVQIFIILVVINVTRSIVQEKSTFRTYLVSIGLRIHTYYLAHFLFNLTKCLLIFSPGLVFFGMTCKTTLGAIYQSITILLFLIPSISFAFLIASFSKSQKSAILACIIIWVLLIITPQIIFGSNHEKLMSYSYVLPSIFVFTFNMFFVKKTLERMEELDQYSVWSSSDRILPLYALWICMILNSVIMFGLAVLIDRSVGRWTPWGWWKRRRALRRHHDNQDEDGKDGAKSPLLVEQDTSVRRKLESDIDICDVVKIYEETGEMAVKGLKMRAIRGQVAVLLGHNGCGKSTTFSMISGMIKPTKGTIQVAGLDVVSNLKEARQKIGLCPQYNPLIDKLTVWEHLKIVHKLKKAQSDFKTEAIELLEAIGLLESKKKLSKNLSGGMKRKLCMLMGLIGESSVVLLDEPTAGMDSTARVDVQTMLRKCKHNRTILLTTHNMDEADKLADWVYVMSDGKIQASGSSQFLKSKFGGGWLVTVVVEEPEKYKNVLLELCQKFETASKIKDVRGQMIELSIPSEDKSKVIELLKCLETISEKNFDSEVLKKYGGKIQNIKITSIGVSLNSLEQVFINVIEQCEKDAKKLRNEEEKRETLKKVIANKFENPTKIGILSQFIGLSLKRFIHFRRNWITNLVNFFVPIVIMCWLLSAKSSKELGNERDLEISVKEIPENSIVIIHTDSIDGSKWIRDYFAKNSGLVIREISINRKMIDILKEEQFFRRISVVVRAEDQGKKVKKIYVHENLNLYKTIAAFLNVNLNKARDWQYHFHWILYDEQGFDGVISSMSNILAFLFAFAILVTYNSSQCGFLHVEERVSKFKRQQFLTEMSPFIYWFSMYFWEFVIFAVQTSALISLFAIFGYLSGMVLFQLFLVCCMVWMAIVPVVFLFSFLVNSSTKITILVLVFCFLLPAIKMFAEPIMLNGLRLRGTKYLHFIRFLFPFQSFLALCFWIYYLSNPTNFIHLRVFINIYFYAQDQHNPEDIDILKVDLINLAISSLFFNFVLFTFTSHYFRRFWNWIWHSRHVAREACQLTMEPCPLVQKEQEDIEKEVINHENSTVIIDELVKRFGKYQAVNGIFLGVRNGGCFGLLGVNGAGKTTTIEILTGEKLACSGEAIIEGKSVRKSLKLGFCPQFDAILPDLTGREVLEIMTRLQNYKNPSSMVEDLIDCVGMRGNTSKPIKLCSGGQKRKISMACAILSRGKLCILDEPTAGVDPKARRDLWDIVGGIRDGNCGGGGISGSVETTGTAGTGSKEGSEQSSSFLLTSHSMEECEALCTRIGVLRKGNIIALGSCQELKSTYGNTFTLTICLKLSEVSQNEKKKEIVREVKEKFAANLLTDENDDVATDLVFEIPRKKSDKWSTKMAEVKKLADEMEIKDYYLVQSSLEDVFIKMNSQSIEKKDPQNTFSVVGTSIVNLFESRYHKLSSSSNQNSTTTIHKIFRYSLTTFQYIWAFTFILPAFLNIPDPDFAIQKLTKALPCVDSTLFQSPYFFCLTFEVGIAVFSILTTLTLIISQGFFYIISSFRILNKNKTASSKGTYQLRMKFMLALCLQVFIPMIFLVIPASFIVFSLYTRYFNQGLTNLSTIFFATHGGISSIVTVIVHKPYRDFTIELVYRVTLFRIGKRSLNEISVVQKKRPFSITVL